MSDDLGFPLRKEDQGPSNKDWLESKPRVKDSEPLSPPMNLPHRGIHIQPGAPPPPGSMCAGLIAPFGGHKGNSELSIQFPTSKK